LNYDGIRIYKEDSILKLNLDLKDKLLRFSNLELIALLISITNLLFFINKILNIIFIFII